jgi:hypothetical protein
MGAMIWLVIAGAALVVLAGAVVVALRAPRVGKAALAVVVLASGTFSVALYRSRIEPEPAAVTPVVAFAATPWHMRGAPAQRLSIAFGAGDKFPQGSFYLDPVRVGPDLYTGDVTIQCLTPAKDETVQNCTGGDERAYMLEMLKQRTLVAESARDALTDPGACDEAAGATYHGDYLPVVAARTYCLRRRGDFTEVVAVRIASVSTAQPMPAGIDLEATIWTR